MCQLERIQKMLKAPLPFESPYDAGFDAGKNGPNTTNCHFRFFATRESSDEWSRGNKVGVDLRVKGERKKGRRS